MTITNETRKAIYRRDGYRCALCDCTTGLQIHHYLRRGDGGSNSPHNLITLCATCHAQVHGHLLVDGGWSAEDVEQAAVEYLADYYAGEWNPWRRE